MKAPPSATAGVSTAFLSSLVCVSGMKRSVVSVAGCDRPDVMDRPDGCRSGGAIRAWLSLEPSPTAARPVAKTGRRDRLVDDEKSPTLWPMKPVGQGNDHTRRWGYDTPRTNAMTQDAGVVWGRCQTIAGSSGSLTCRETVGDCVGGIVRLGRTRVWVVRPATFALAGSEG